MIKIQISYVATYIYNGNNSNNCIHIIVKIKIIYVDKVVYTYNWCFILVVFSLIFPIRTPEYNGFMMYRSKRLPMHQI